MILYHIMADTGCLPDDVIPQIPTNRMKGEDQEIPRICLGHTLDDCLTSIGIAHFVSKFLLAELRQNKKIQKLWLVGGEVVLWPYIVDGVVYNYPIVRNSIWADSKTLPDPEFQNQIMDITQKWLNEA